MRVSTTHLPGVVVIEPHVFEDDRGWFMEAFNEAGFHHELRVLGLPVPRSFVQDNHSCSRRGVLRGLHMQREPYAQGKLVRVTSGAAWDVAVDLRPESAHFGQWVGLELSAHNRRQVWIPEGFAHGFLALHDYTELLYKTTATYSREAEVSIAWDDPDLAISWPMQGLGGGPTLSKKDLCAPRLR
jgi:dTDP-4-dehydrorhamnose 3,5-epimerase